jgi:hypothetical protein
MNTNPIAAPYLHSTNHQSSGIFSRLLTRYLAYADAQQNNRMLWFFLSLMLNGVFFLAAPAILIWMFQAPLAVLAITVLTFFSNLIANMGGAGIRTTLTLFYAGLLINIGCILYFTL